MIGGRVATPKEQQARFVYRIILNYESTQYSYQTITMESADNSHQTPTAPMPEEKPSAQAAFAFRMKEQNRSIRFSDMLR